MLSKNQLILFLNNITFVCIDEVDVNHGDYEIKLMVQNEPDFGKTFLSSRITRWANSDNTKKAYETFLEAPNWDNFHTVTHYLMIDKLVHFLKTGEGSSLETTLEQSLNCGIAPENVVESLNYYIKQPKQKAA